MMLTQLCNMPICLAKPHWASYAQVVEIHRKFQHNGSGMPTPPHPTHYWSSVSYSIHELILSRELASWNAITRLQH